MAVLRWCLSLGAFAGLAGAFGAAMDTPARPRALVPLGCARAWRPAATLDDGQLPLLQPGEDGLVLRVENAGTHHVTLDLALPWTPRGTKGAERGFDLGLPRAAITVL